MAIVLEGYLHNGYEFDARRLGKGFVGGFERTRSPKQGHLSVDLWKLADGVYTTKGALRVRVTITKVRSQSCKTARGK